MLFRNSNDPDRPNAKPPPCFDVKSLRSAVVAGCGVMDCRDCTCPVVVGRVDTRQCVPVREVSRSNETGAAARGRAALFNSCAITVLIMFTRLRQWITLILNMCRLIDLIRRQITLSVAKSRTNGDVSSLSVCLRETLSLSLLFL